MCNKCAIERDYDAAGQPLPLRSAIERDYDAAGQPLPLRSAYADSLEVIARHKHSHTMFRTVGYFRDIKAAKLAGARTLHHMPEAFDRIEIERSGVVVASMGAM